ncbi:MAG: hypothetical protein WAU53_00550 [Rhodoplanes sp.]
MNDHKSSLPLDIAPDRSGIVCDHPESSRNAVGLVPFRKTFREKTFDAVHHMLVRILKPRQRRYVIDFDAIWENNHLSDSLERGNECANASGTGVIRQSKRKPALRVIF